MSLAKNHPLYLILLVFVVAGCGGDPVPPASDLAATADLASVSDFAALSPNGTCPATVSLEHICNTFAAPGYCLYRDTQRACVQCAVVDAPTGCVGTFSPANSDGGMRDFICVESCSECQPRIGQPPICFTE